MEHRTTLPEDHVFISRIPFPDGVDGR